MLLCRRGCVATIEPSCMSGNVSTFQEKQPVVQFTLKQGFTTVSPRCCEMSFTFSLRDCFGMNLERYAQLQIVNLSIFMVVSKNSGETQVQTYF